MISTVDRKREVRHVKYINIFILKSASGIKTFSSFIHKYYIQRNFEILARKFYFTSHRLTHKSRIAPMIILGLNGSCRKPYVDQ
jgi:hypothetical protein